MAIDGKKINKIFANIRWIFWGEKNDRTWLIFAWESERNRLIGTARFGVVLKNRKCSNSVHSESEILRFKLLRIKILYQLNFKNYVKEVIINKGKKV